MCGRYRLSRRKQVIEEHFDAISDTEDWEPRFDIAPTQPVPVIRQNPEGQLFAFAGLWEGWKDHSGTWIKTCTILTTTPNAVTSAVHDRMPVILHPGDYDLWLDLGIHDTAMTLDLLKPYNAALMRSYPISTRINNVANDDTECARPIQPGASPQGQLFE